MSSYTDQTYAQNVATDNSSGSNSGTGDDYSVPNYQRYADNHNYGNGNFAVTDPSTWGDGVKGAGMFIVSAAASGLNSFYNTGVSVANWFGADAQKIDTAEQLGRLDDDLGQYYQRNKEAADLGGFVVSSLVPGLGGIKLLNAGQKMLRTSETGIIGSNLSKGLGLLTPAVDAYRIRAAADIAVSSATASATSANTLRAITAGYGQAALESAAFEMAVTATMNQSPVLDKADGWDITKNILTGTLVGGVIGGAVNHAVTLGGIKQAVRKVNPEEKMFTDTTNTVGYSPAQRIIERSSTLEKLPNAPTAEDIASGGFKGVASVLDKMPAQEKEVMAAQFSTKFTRLRAETENSILQKNRADVHEIVTGDDKELGNLVADAVHGLDSNTMAENFSHLTSLGRISTKLAEEKVAEKFVKEQATDLSKIDLADTTAGSLAITPTKIGYLKLSGEGAGDVSFEAPKVLGLADTLADSKAVLKKVDSYKFKENKLFDVTAQGTDLQAIQARYIWADRSAVVTEGMRIGEHDIPLLEKAVKQGLSKIEAVSTDGTSYPITSAEDIYKHLTVSKQESAMTLQQSAKAGATDGMTTPEIARAVNMRTSLLEGDVGSNSIDDFFARQMDKVAYIKDLQAKGLYTAEKEASFDLMPTYTKVAYDSKAMQDTNGFEITGMAYLKAQQKLYQQGVDNVFAHRVPQELADRFQHPEDSLLLTSDRYGSGPGIASSANGGYGSLASFMEQTGAATSGLQKHFVDKVTTASEAHAYNIVADQDTAIGFEAINKHIQSTSELYGIRADGSGISPLKIIDWEQAVADLDSNVSALAKATAAKDAPEVARLKGLVKLGSGEAPMLQEGAPRIVPITNPKVLAAWDTRTSLTGEFTQGQIEIRNAQGLTDMKDPRALRPIRPDPKEFTHFAVVSDPAITGVGHKSMIHAASAEELEAMIDRVPKNYQVFKKDQLEAHFKGQDLYDYNLTLHENYIDGNLKQAGVNNPFFIRTDPQKIATSYLEDIKRTANIHARELVNAKYEKEFAFLRQQGEQFNSAATSRYTGSYRDIEATANNPYTNYIKTALNISQVNEHPLIMGVNNTLDKYATKAWNTVTDAFNIAKSPADLDNINALMGKYGVKSAYYDAATNLLANHTAPKGALSTFVNRANSVLSTVILRLDPLNAVNNAVGQGVLYGTETKSVIRTMQGDQDSLNKLAGLLKTPVPSSGMGTAGADSVMSAGKLMLSSMKNFTDPTATTLSGESLKAYYQRNGWSTRLVDQFHSVIDNLSLQGTESVGVMQKKIQDAFAGAKVLAEKGEVFTGNKLAEEFNRFVSADTMRQLTDVGVKAGRITPQEQISYINTFVNRVQGNMLASQRPLMFQGPVGQAIGLFQTYQFNMMQQMFRHVAEGAPKDAAMLLGLQGTIYGMNGLPAFNYLNTHIVGTASGNPNHTDLYSATYGIAGKSIGDLLLYGLPSNMLRANLYTRGDINPRQATVVPTNPLDIPFVNATIKMYDNVKGMLGKMENGGSIWQSFLQGVEHNGLSRPLAGIAQTMQAATHTGLVFSTTSKGSISDANDLASWGTAVRLAGGKPLDEAIAHDAVFRIGAYQSSNRAQMDSLNQAIRSRVIAGGVAEQDEQATFAAKYAALGGRQMNFNKYMINQYKQANTAEANKIAEALRNPYSQKMQQIMGGQELLDGRAVQQQQ